MKPIYYVIGGTKVILTAAMLVSISAHESSVVSRPDGKRLFERETFGGNGRTCSTCHTSGTGTISPIEAQKRFEENARDPLFVHDGSDNGTGKGASRMLKDATVLVEIPLPPNVSLADDPTARSVVVRRGIPSTLNTPALDRVLMMDGRQPDLASQAASAIAGHAQAKRTPTEAEIRGITEFEASDDAFFSSPALREFAHGGPAPQLPPGRTDAEKRGRRFFEDVTDLQDFKHGACAACHSGPMLNETNELLFAVAKVPVRTRFQSVRVSEVNDAHNPVHEYVFTDPDGTTTRLMSPDPGRALITGIGKESGQFDNVNAFKIPTLWGVSRTAPYFHDNSSRTLEDVVAHYNKFFEVASDPDGPGPKGPLVVLSQDDEADIVAYLKLLK
jgi:cytochrome c peroxidase